jgi:hypothetical protein
MVLADTVANWVIKELPHDRADANVVAALRRKHPGELLTFYFNWRNRLIPIQPRQVMRAVEFDQNPVVAQRPTVIAEIIRDIERGSDLTKYLSRRVVAGFELPRNPNKKNLRRLLHLDLLLNEWGIYHFHLSTNVEHNGSVERDDPLLFVMFRADKAYLLNIGTHQSFEDDRLAQVAISNWPNDQLFIEIKGILGTQRGSSYNSAERKQLRAAGISTLVQVNNRVFSAAGGISTAGTSSQASLCSMTIMRALAKFEEHVLADSSQVVAFIRKHGGTPGAPPEFEFSFFENGFGVIEKSSGIPILLQG